jgi:predicted dehydrogenase
MVYHFSAVESGAPQMELRLNGSRGALRFDVLNSQLSWAAAGQVEARVIELPLDQQRGWQVEADFVRSIRSGERAYLTSFEQGVHYMKFTQMVAASLAQNGQRIAW